MEPRQPDTPNARPDAYTVETPRRWNRNSKLLMLIVALVPAAGLVPLIAVHASSFSANNRWLAYGGHVVLLMSFLALLFYGRLLIGNQRLRRLRYMWGLAFVLLPFVALPLYWWQHVWLDPPPDRYDYNQPGGAPADREGRPEGHAPG